MARVKSYTNSIRRDRHFTSEMESTPLISGPIFPPQFHALLVLYISNVFSGNKDRGEERGRIEDAHWEGWTLKKRRNSCSHLEGMIQCRDKAVSRFPPLLSAAKNGGRWVSLKIGLVRHALCREDSVSPLSSFAHPTPLRSGIYSFRLFLRALNSTALGRIRYSPSCEESNPAGMHGRMRRTWRATEAPGVF